MEETKTLEWAERVGLEAVAAGMPAREGLQCGYLDVSLRLSIVTESGWAKCWPDFRDRLTALACIAWVEDVAREKYGDGVALVLGVFSAVVRVTIEYDPPTPHFLHREDAPTLVEACIAAVRAMKGAK